jgi:hypothetical protein
LSNTTSVINKNLKSKNPEIKKEKEKEKGASK